MFNLAIQIDPNNFSAYYHKGMLPNIYCRYLALKLKKI